MAEKTLTVCNVCGETFKMWDTQEDRSIHDMFGYGSKYDGDKINLDLCCGCFDKVFDFVRKISKIDPLVEME